MLSRVIIFILTYRRSSCIGGVGVFLIMTGFVPFFRFHPTSETRISLTVCLGMSDGAFQEAPLQSIRHMFMDAHTITLWLLPLSLAVLLRLITHRFHHQLIFPLCLCQLFQLPKSALTPLHRFYCYSFFVLYRCSCRRSTAGRSQKKRMVV